MRDQLSMAGAFASIRRARLADRERLLSADGNPVFWRECGFDSPEGYARALDGAFADHNLRTTRPSTVVWMVMRAREEAPIGMAVLWRGRPGFGDGAAGIFHDKDRGRGIALDALVLPFATSFRELGLRHISSTVRPDNGRAIRFWMKLGMRAEGWTDSPGDGPSGTRTPGLRMGVWDRDFFGNPLVAQVLAEAGRR